jgi:3-hydroxyisobutyrate dehydrogenase-like beta-hydroxyacid dehydrogenase
MNSKPDQTVGDTIMSADRVNAPKIAFIGFGEAANAFVSGWALDVSHQITGYDVKTDNPTTAPAMTAQYARAGVACARESHEALVGADYIFSVVTAEQALAAALAGAGGLQQGAFWFDCNSCAPDTKRRAAEIIQAAGGRYIDVAVMAPVHPKRHHVPLKIAGPHAEAGAIVLRSMDMRPEVVGNEVGQASSIKMIRSVMIKGLEALTTECFLAARRAGVEDAVIGALEASDPDVAWRKRGSYNLERMMVHGARRASEMREVAITLADLGIPNHMSAASAVWQDQVASASALPGDNDLMGRFDSLLAQLTPSEKD